MYAECCYWYMLPLAHTMTLHIYACVGLAVGAMLPLLAAAASSSMRLWYYYCNHAITTTVRLAY